MTLFDLVNIVNRNPRRHRPKSSFVNLEGLNLLRVFQEYKQAILFVPESLEKLRNFIFL